MKKLAHKKKENVCATVSTIAILYFMWVWNDFIYHLVCMQDEAKWER